MRCLSRLRWWLFAPIVNVLELMMSKLDDLNAAVARNDAGIAHVQALLKEATDKINAAISDEDAIDVEALEEVVEHLNSGADTLNGMSLSVDGGAAPQQPAVPSTTSEVPGATTANQDLAQADPGPATPPVDPPVSNS